MVLGPRAVPLVVEVFRDDAGSSEKKLKTEVVPAREKTSKQGRATLNRAQVGRRLLH